MNFLKVGCLVVSTWLLASCTSPTGAASSGGSSKPDVYDEGRAAVAGYSACEGGMTVAEATPRILRLANVQSWDSKMRFTSGAGRDLYRFGYDYKAANGSSKQVLFGYQPSTGNVGAENDDGRGVLNFLK